ncbi:Tol-Pal system beta propeller repeat protein TolB [Noviherbaspirillum agri]
MKNLISRGFVVLLIAVTGFAQAQLRVETSGVGATQIPIAIAGFTGEAMAPQQVTAIIKADLANSGYFRIIDTGNTMSETTAVNYTEWKSQGADALVVGSVQRLADGRFDVRYRLLDTLRATSLSGFGQVAGPDRMRVAAHKISDDIYEKLLGVRGAFATRIAYVTKTGNEYRLEVADADGEGTQVALRSNEPIISPTWSPDGTRVAYVSFENKKPVVYVQDLTSRRRTAIANYRGSNSAPSWSPDGSRLALALSRNGYTQVYIVNADGSNLRQVTNTTGIETEPRFSADGQHIYFTSDRSGGPQIYRMSINGGDAQRITFSGSYNVSPRVSPDGKSLAFISRREGRFQLYVLDLASGQELRLSDTLDDESPSFSPNGKYLMYATKAGRRDALAVVSVDGRVKYRLTPPAGDIREPTWGPFMK